MQASAVIDRHVQVRANRFFGKEAARFAFVEGDGLVHGREGWKPAADGAGIEHFVRQVVLPGAAKAAGHHLAIGGANHQAAGDLEKTASGIHLETTP